MAGADKKLKIVYNNIMFNFNNKIKNIIIFLFDHYNILKFNCKLTIKQEVYWVVY